MDFANIPSFITPYLIPFLIFCLAIGLMVETIKKIIEKIPQINNKKKINFFWKEMLLPTLPILFGLFIGGFFQSYPYPEMFLNSLIGRIFYGMTCGFASGYIYRVAKSYFLKLSKSEDKEGVS